MKNRISFIQYKVYLLALCVIITGSSCKKSFLNLAPYDGVPASGAVTSEATMYSAVVGLYSSLRATDFYGRTYAIKGDLITNLIVQLIT